jgi:hypothetical protein
MVTVTANGDGDGDGDRNEMVMSMVAAVVTWLNPFLPSFIDIPS